MAPNVGTMRNILMELRKICQHPYLSAPELEDLEAPEEEQQKHLVDGSGKLAFLKLLLPKLKERGHRVLLFSQFKIALDRIEDFLYGEGYKFLRLDGDVQQAVRQKSMDAYNAPGSDYSIFLLTTRAGGVGINLATADTVIVYDPDFNPHMDLQAIARAHRYGQKKKVMVFKLMTKNSVEEQIILNGKKKMVLDHLVVQQMGKENEEGDIDNMLLHGAAALYEAGEDGVAASDIRYTSQNVDELIDRVQKDAEDEAAAIALRESGAQVEVNGVDDAAKPKESMSFGFAKIWEADKNRLQEVEDEEGRAEEQDRYMQSILASIEMEKRRKMLAGVDENAKARRRAVKNIKYAARADGGMSDDTPKKKDAKGKGKYGKYGKNNDSSDDVDFALVGATEESDDDSDVSDEGQEDLLNGDPSYGGLNGIAKKAHKLAMKRQMREAAAATAGAGANPANINGTGPSTNTPPVTSSSSRLTKSTPSSRGTKGPPSAQKIAARAARKAEKDDNRNKRYSFARQMLMENPDAVQQLVTQPTYDRTSEKISGGQQVLQWLYHVLRQLGMKPQLDIWALMALPEIAASERQKFYVQLGEKADMEMVRRGGARYFTVDNQLDVVIPLFQAGAPVIPDEMSSNPVLDIPIAAGDGSASISNGPVRVYDKHLPTPYASPQPIRRELPETTRRELLQQMTGSAKTAATAITVDKRTSVPPPAPSRRISQPAIPRRLPTPPPEPVRFRPADAHCEYCDVRGHDVSTCTVLPTKATLEEYRTTVIQSDEPEAEKLRGVTKIDQLLALHEAAATRLFSGRNGEHSNGQTNNSLSRGFPAIIGENQAAPNAKRPRVDAGPSSLLPKSHGSKRNHGCSICRAPRNHAATLCPTVQAGPSSIMEAMKRFDPQDPMWHILQKLYDHYRQSEPGYQSSAPPRTICAFCRETCGRDIRGCVESHGGRRLLKDRIRVMERSRDGEFAGEDFSKEEGHNMINQLFDAYLMWPK